MKIRTRLYAAFGALMIMSTGLAVTGVVQNRTVGANVATMDQLSRTIVRVLDAVHRSESLRRLELEYRTTSDDSVIETAGQQGRALTALFVDLSRDAAAGPQAARYKEASQALATHQASWDNFIKGWQLARDLRAKLAQSGDEIAAATVKLVAAAQAGGNAEIILNAAKVDSAVHLVGETSWKFLVTNERETEVAFRANSEKALEALTMLDMAFDPTLMEFSALVRTGLNDYATSFVSYSAAKLAGIELLDQELAPQIVGLQGKLAEIEASQRREFASRAEASEQTARRASDVQIWPLACPWWWAPGSPGWSGAASSAPSHRSRGR